MLALRYFFLYSCFFRGFITTLSELYDISVDFYIMQQYQTHSLTSITPHSQADTTASALLHTQPHCLILHIPPPHLPLALELQHRPRINPHSSAPAIATSPQKKKKNKKRKKEIQTEKSKRKKKENTRGLPTEIKLVRTGRRSLRHHSLHRDGRVKT